MANRYWVGGTGNWNETAGTKWAASSGGPGGETVPTTADDVFFDGASGANTVTISSGNTGAKSITCTGFTGTLAGTIGISVAGNVTLVAGMTVTYSGTLTITGTSTIVSAGKTLGPLTVNGSGITVTLGDALTLSAGILLTQGTFDTANYNVTATALSSSNSNTRTMTLGSSTVTLSGNVPINFATSTNFTFNANTSQITLTSTSSTLSVEGGGRTFYNVTANANTSSVNSVGGANTFNNLTVSASSASLKVIEFTANQTVNGTFTVAGASAVNRIFVRSGNLNTSRTITAATLSATDADFRDITIAGGASGSSPTRAGDCKGNSGITFPAAKTVYWNLAGSVNWDATGWADGSGGTPAVNNFPLAQDTAVFNDTGSMGTVQLNANWNVGTIDSSARTSAGTLNFASAFDGFIYGSLSFGTGITVSGVSGSQPTFAGRSTQTITSNGKTIPFSITINSLSGTVRLIDDLTYSSANSFALSEGTLDLNGKTLSITSNNFSTGVGTKNITFNGGTIAISNATTTAWNNAQPTGFTTTAGTGTGKISMTAATAKTFVGGGSTYNCTLSNDGAGALTITGSNTFTTLANGVQPTTFTFTAGTTTTVTNWNVNGTSGNLVTIGSATAASHTLSKSTGTVSSNYLSISRSTATGGATWYAGANSTDGGNNTGWIFTAPPSAAGGNFFMLFS